MKFAAPCGLVGKMEGSIQRLGVEGLFKDAWNKFSGLGSMGMVIDKLK